MHQNNYPGLGVVVNGVENEYEKIDVELLERFKDNKLGVQYVSLKLSAKEGIINAIRMKF